MDPKSLIDQSALGGMPAPVWFIELFKWLGFTLHMVPMNLWYGGTITAMLLYAFGGENARRFSSRLMAQMPVIIATGINFGIVPLLFIQVGFGQVFYPATILMAWFWFSVIVMLVPAYYGVYLYACGQAEQASAMPWWKRAAGWFAAVLFILIGFIFANAMSLMENVKAWPDLWQQHSFHGATLGTALNTVDLRLWPRWLLMFGLALTTTAAWSALDSAWFARRDSDAYRLWTKEFSWKLYTIGLLWFAIVGAWYSFGTWPADTKQTMFFSPWAGLTAVTAIAPGAVWALLWLVRRRESEIGRGWASLIGLAQFGVLGINAMSRQVVQHLELGAYFDISNQSTEPQWGPLGIFVAMFVVGLALTAWMIYQVWKVPAEPDIVSPSRGQG
jgi:hypothetical protein